MCVPFPTRMLSVCLLALLMSLPAFGADRKAVPTLDEQTKSRKEVRELFKAEYAKRKDEDQLALANKLIETARETRDDATACYVLLDEAIKIAAKLADLEVAMEAVDEIIEGYNVESLKVRGKALYRVGESARKPEQAEAVAQGFLELALEAQAADDYEIATRAIHDGLRYAKKGNDRELLGQIQKQEKNIRELELFGKQLAKAKATLATTPEDPDANLVCGRYHCFIKEDWGTGLPLLKRGADADLRALAMLELQPPKYTKEFVTLGDGWSHTAEKESMPRVKRVIRVRALDWYDRALTDLSGLNKVKVNQKADTLRRVLDDAGAATTVAEAKIEAPAGYLPGLIVSAEPAQHVWDGTEPLAVPGDSWYVLVGGRVIMPKNYASARMRLRLEDTIFGKGQILFKVGSKSTPLRKEEDFVKIPRRRKYVNILVRCHQFDRGKIEWTVAALEWSLDDGPWQPIPANRLYYKKGSKKR